MQNAASEYFIDINFTQSFYSQCKRSAHVSQHPQLKWQDFVGEKFLFLHAVAEGIQHIQIRKIRKKMLSSHWCYLNRLRTI